MAIITSASTYIRTEDVEYKRSVSENILTKVGASMNYILDNAQLTDPQVYSQVFTASGTFTVPAGVTRAKVTCVGGGAGGALGAEFPTSGGGGGGTSFKLVSGLTPAGTVAVTVGAGGASNANGIASSFGAHSSANGGLSSGAGGSGSGDLIIVGQSGGAAGAYVNSGGNSHFGYGGRAVPTLEGAKAAEGYGGGGGGSGGSGSAVSVAGGAGTGGFVLVEWVA